MYAPPLLRSPLLLIGLALRCSVVAQQNDAEKSPPPSTVEMERQASFGYMAPAREAYQGSWNVTEANNTAALWRTLCEARPADVDAQLNWFRSERNARLVQNNGQLDAKDQQELRSIADHIGSNAPGSFQQCISTYYLDMPASSAFKALEKANTLAPEREELVLPMIVRANLDGDKPALDRWCGRFEKDGGLAPALSTVASDLLLSVDKEGVLFVNGDLDGAPVLVRQRLHDERRDVLVIDQRLLSDPAYRQRVWSEAGGRGAVPGAGIEFAQQLASSTSRTLFLALSLSPEWFNAFNGRLCPTGIAFRVDASECPTRLLTQRWIDMRKPLSAGPLSRNYLLPGCVLLQRYRTAEDEAKASLLEKELREMATRLGATQDLIKAGVFLH